MHIYLIFPDRSNKFDSTLQTVSESQKVSVSACGCVYVRVPVTSSSLIDPYSFDLIQQTILSAKGENREKVSQKERIEKSTKAHFICLKQITPSKLNLLHERYCT